MILRQYFVFAMKIAASIMILFARNLSLANENAPRGV